MKGFERDNPYFSLCGLNCGLPVKDRVGLMGCALAGLEAYDRTAVWVLRGNERAIRFYTKCGYRFDGKEQTVKLGTEAAELRMILER